MNAAVPQQLPAAPRREAGSVLQSAREAAGMSVADVSRHLNLAKPVITALETGDTDALPPVAFVRGYLRSYAKLLDLDEDAVLGLLDTDGVADRDISPVTVLSSQRVSNDPLMRWMSVAVFFVLAVMVVIWWQTKNGDDPTLASAPENEVVQQPEQSAEMITLQSELAAAAEQTQAGQPPVAQSEPAPETRPAVVAEPVVDVNPEFAQTPAETATGVAADHEPATATVASAGEQQTSVPEVDVPETSVDASAVQQSAEPAPAPVDVAVVAEPPALPDVETLDSAAAADTMSSPPAPADTSTGVATESLAAAETHEVVLLVDGSTWAEVRDARGQQLYYGLYESPAPLRLIGELPFVVFLGNSPAVTILFNGETYDQTSFNRANNTARFALDGAGLRQP